MNLVETFRIGLHGITANKLRSGLTVLGILMGVAAVIVRVAVGNGSSRAVSASIEKLGTNALLVRHGTFGFGPGGGGGGRNSGSRTQLKDLTVDDAIAMADPTVNPDVKSASPVVQAQVTCAYEGTSYSTSMTGTWPSYFEASNFPIGSGTYVTNDDVVGGTRNIVLGQTVVDNLFGTVSPIGKQVSCQGIPFNITGVLQKKGSTGFQDADDVIIAPLTTVQKYVTGFGSLDSIVAQATNSTSQGAAQAEISAVLDARHGITSTANRDYQILNQASLLTTADDTTRVFTVLLGAVAAISLLVGGIGITNIMLVTVTERTREIGIRKAIGASKGAILGQFLVEATVLSMVGGVAGVIVAMIVTRFSIAGIQPAVLPLSVVGAFAVSVALGLFFGSYPANRAASLRPIEALRHE